MDTYSLLELNEYIRRVVALNFEAAIWVNCEISQARQSRGHMYLELVQKAEHSDDILAQSSAAIWSSKLRQIHRKSGDVLFDILSDGSGVRVQVKVDFHERYGLKLIIEDVDTSYTLGNLELRRREILESLQKRGLVERNKSLDIPLVPQRIAVLSSEGAAGYQDFMTHLAHNAYGYHFDTYLYTVALQGQNIERDVVDALGEVSRASDHYDCAVIIRGGGSRMDLSGFDNEKIGEAIANCPIPVITGIGHEIDQSVADVVSHTSLKTPTAVADFLIELLLDFEGVLDTTFDRIADSIQMTVTDQRNRLKQAAAFLSYAPRQMISSQRAFLEMATPQMRQAASSRLRNATTFLKHAEDIMHAVEPKNVLKRGFSITKINGKLLRDVEDLAEGDKVETELTDHIITSTVKEWHQKN